MTTRAVIHTTTATVAPLKILAAEALPSATIVKFADDSILPQDQWAQCLATPPLAIERVRQVVAEYGGPV